MKSILKNKKEFAKKWAENYSAGHVDAVKEKNEVIRVPVVVHVLYNTTEENISDAQVQSQIDVLNEDFRGTNADINKVPDHFFQVAADCEIEFFLATKDPQGNTTNGIVRTNTSLTSFSSDEGKMHYTSEGGSDSWGPNRYMNIWVCNLVGTDPSQTLFGHATRYMGINSITFGRWNCN